MASKHSNESESIQAKPAKKSKAKKITPAAQGALRAVFESEPVSVYISRGFSGCATPKVKIVGPTQLRRQTFERLKALDYMRLLGRDDFKEIWDISEAGLAVLVEVDPEIAGIEPIFLKRRLDAPLEVYRHDDLGLIGRPN